MIRRSRVVNLLVSLGILFTSLVPGQAGRATSSGQANSPQVTAQTLLAELTPEEKVGQLFLVTFRGGQFDADSPVLKLISDYHVGGVVLQSSNDNFTGPDQTVAEAHRMITELQTFASTYSSGAPADTQLDRNPPENYIPLFVGLSQEGDGYPYDQILSGLTPIPNEMAVGATWNTQLAYKVGTVVGKELRALGINLFLGPSLDVLDRRYSDTAEDLGTRTFGGDPFWVGELGKSLISGIHQGSSGRIAVISKHFPGRGGSDRLPEDEVATVRKSLEQLKQIELSPFFAVTENVPAHTATDGLLISHIRYQGLQGNIRAITRPVSLDPTALGQLMDLTPFATWRDSGGVVVSDDLGSRAVRQFYDPSMKNFDARQVARDALLAGNDLLYVDNFVATGDADTFMTLGRTLSFFAQKYREDPVFAQRVDTAVTRILNLKLKLYPSFDLARVLPTPDGLTEIGTVESQQISQTVASEAVTLISPSSAADLDNVLPQPPDRGDRIIFITDTQTTRQCSQCPDQDLMSVDALQNAVLKLYGPSTSGQVIASRLSSYSFNDLTGLLNGASDLPPLENDLRQATWVVFSTLNSSKDRPASAALRRLLSERPDLLQKNQRVIVFAFNAPYYLDATDISKVTAYYGLFSKIPAFVEVAAKVLFQEMPPAGNLPISVAGVGYDLSVMTSPDPSQIIPLALDLPASEPSGEATPEPTEAPTFSVGDLIPVRTGVILDHNQHVVPDGTVVRFILSRNGDTAGAQQVEAVTKQGIAHASLRIENPGLLDIRATSDPALTSDILQLDISKGESAGVTAIAPTPVPTGTPTPTPSPTPSPTPEATPLPPPPVRPEFGDWLLAMLVISGGGGLIFLFGRWWASIRWGLRWGLCSALGGLAAYAYLAVDLPGGAPWLDSAGKSGILMLTLFGVLLGWLGGVAWRSWLDQRSIQKPRR